MKTLILKKTRQHYGESHWLDNDFVVPDRGKVVGRVMRHPQAPEEQPWFWTITQGLPPSTKESRLCGYTLASDDGF
jgi:hypothetical protein